MRSQTRKHKNHFYLRRGYFASIACHTVERLSITQKLVTDSLHIEELNQMFLYTGWDFDGSSGHSYYEQAFYGHGAGDSVVFITSIVPLRLVCGGKIAWQNLRPASTRYCRRLKTEFIKESAEVSLADKNKGEAQINKPLSITVIVEEKSFAV